MDEQKVTVKAPAIGRDYGEGLYRFYLVSGAIVEVELSGFVLDVGGKFTWAIWSDGRQATELVSLGSGAVQAVVKVNRVTAMAREVLTDD